MLSLQQAIEIKESIKSYLQATFTFRKKEVAESFENFIDHPTQGMFKGPYISLKLRFVKAEQSEIDKIPLTIKPSWPPYDHQVKAWTKLATLNKLPEPTIVTTGTGSGKTESFLYPMLDYCFQQQHRPGIKVIILYPMNALATDQAKRLAEMIYEDKRLKGKISAGLFIGEGNGPKGQFPKVMGQENIVEHRDSILDAPPDILLTNFKMLDYALMKHNFHKLWMHNLNDTTLLQFLVLDELHTYDGAQGTDVANLIRRLKLKLNITARQLCPVGTSATIGSGPEAPTLLAEYATKVFGEEITTEAIITENRISPNLFFAEEEVLNDFIPLPNKLKKLVYREYEEYDTFIQQHIEIWQQDK
ncbi:MAG: DEAD/DEAH box helicase, partial [Flavobacterium sp.]